MTSGVPHLSQTPAFFGGFMRMWYTVSSFGHTRRPVFRLISSSGSRKKFTAASSFVILDSASACAIVRSEEHTSELQSRGHLVCRLLLEKKKKNRNPAKYKTAHPCT